MKDVRQIGSYVSIVRKSEPDIDTSGVILRYAKDFACVKRFQDFVFWGYEFIGCSDIVSVSLDNREPLRQIAKQESWGAVDDGYEFVTEVDTWGQLAQALFDRGKYASFEHDDDSLYLGRIVTLRESGVDLISVDTQFKHDTEVRYQSYSDLTAIVVGSPYVEFYAIHST